MVELFENTLTPYVCGIIYMITCSFAYTSVGLFFNIVSERNQMGFG